jgi:hypothetical protein
MLKDIIINLDIRTWIIIILIIRLIYLEYSYVKQVELCKDPYKEGCRQLGFKHCRPILEKHAEDLFDEEYKNTKYKGPLNEQHMIKLNEKIKERFLNDQNLYNELEEEIKKSNKWDI